MHSSLVVAVEILHIAILYKMSYKCIMGMIQLGKWLP